MPEPDVAVVIPTYRRETRLRFALEGVAAQTLPRERFETFVVRAPGAEPPFAVAPAGLDVRFLTAERAGAAAQRNAGWRASTAPLVAFMDDDCRPSPGWLEVLLAGAGDRAVVQGRTEPDPDELHLLYGLARTMRVRREDGTFPSCNILYPRGLLEELGGFDEGFPAPWGEDTDLGQRALAVGAEARFADEALVWHAVLANPLPDAIRDARRRRWLPHVIARHPRLRRQLLGGLFVNDAHAALAIAALGSLSSRGWVRRAAWAPYLGRALYSFARTAPPTPRGLARLAVHLPARLTVDAVEVVSSIEGSVRTRTPVV